MQARNRINEHIIGDAFFSDPRVGVQSLDDGKKRNAVWVVLDMKVYGSSEKAVGNAAGARPAMYLRSSMRVSHVEFVT